MSPLLLTDGYKLDHRRQYPAGTTLVYSNWTPRKSRVPGVDTVVFFGLQYFLKEYVQTRFERDFFARPKQEVVDEYSARVNAYLGPDNQVGTEHIAALHDLGYVPMSFKALPEGASVPMRVPMFTMVNTLPEFFWLTNYFETLLSAVVWMPCNSATLAREYRKILDAAAAKTSGAPDFVDFQGHDFLMRGMAGVEAALMSGAGHLLSFSGSDTIPAVDWLERYYNADAQRANGAGAPLGSPVAASVAATEHSVMSMGTQDDELETFRRLIEDVYPSGVVSIVSDTWDLWQVLTEYLPALKDKVLAREGKVVIRPDSGDPADIICGAPSGKTDNERRGVVQLLWDTFGGTVNDKGYKELDPHIGAIYGDSITLDRARDITGRLAAKGFASTNVVLGVGSFTYQYNTRDTFGFAMKATYGEVDGEGRAIYKDPITDDGTKKSARGLVRVERENGAYVLYDEQTWAQESDGELREVFRDGQLLVDWTLAEVRGRARG